MQSDSSEMLQFTWKGYQSYPYQITCSLSHLFKLMSLSEENKEFQTLNIINLLLLLQLGLYQMSDLQWRFGFITLDVRHYLTCLTQRRQYAERWPRPGPMGGLAGSSSEEPENRRDDPLQPQTHPTLSWKKNIWQSQQVIISSPSSFQQQHGSRGTHEP